MINFSLKYGNQIPNTRTIYVLQCMYMNDLQNCFKVSSCSITEEKGGRGEHMG